MQNSAEPMAVQGSEALEEVGALEGGVDSKIEPPREKRRRSPRSEVVSEESNSINFTKRKTNFDEPNKYSNLRSIQTTLYGKAYRATRQDDLPVAIKISDKNRTMGLEDPVKETRLLKILRSSNDCPGKRYICHLLTSFNHEVNSSALDEGGDDDHLLRIDTTTKKSLAHWSVFEWANGGELLYFVSSIDQPTAKRLFHQICQAVDFMHRNGIAHMDLSVENIIIHWPEGKSKGQPIAKIIDFGQAVEIASTTSRLGRGKQRYMAPELLEQKDADAELADAYSLGVILFLLVTFGTPPYDNIGDEAFNYVWFRGKQGFSLLLRSWEKEVPPDALDLIAKLICPVEKRINLQAILNHPYLHGSDGGGHRNR
mmetsp:Transcript_2398/g.4624  ORF Transcript_2398/g.4624 Transcript_2398/m.4624 type:complete len:370 (-) Transcript_2398:745-1854(-)